MPIICIRMYIQYAYMRMCLMLNCLFLDFNSAVELGQTTCNYDCFFFLNFFYTNRTLK